MTLRLAPASAPDQPRGRALRARLDPRRNATVAAMVVLIAMLATWLYAGRWYQDRLMLEQRAQAVSEVSVHGSALSSALSRRLARLQGLHAFVHSEGAEPDFGQKFERFAADLYAGSRGIRNLAVAPDGELRHVYPLEGNQAVLGYQPLLDPRPEVVADVQRAIDTGQAIVSGPFELIQGGPGLIARQAVFQDGRYWGLVNVVIDLDPLLTESGVVSGSGELQFALRDHQGRVFFGPTSLFSSSPIITQIILPEGYWELAGAPREGWLATIWQPLLIAWIGSLVSIALITSMVYLTVNRQNQLTAAVEQRTQELSVANVQLEHRVEERTLELTMLLNISRSIASTLKLDELLEQVLHKLSPVVNYTGGAILTLEDGTFAVWAYQGYFPPMSTPNRSFPIDNIIGRQLVEKKKPVLISDVSADSLVARTFLQATGLQNEQLDYIRSWMGIPLIAREKVIGMLALHHREAGIFDAQDADLAMTFANHVAVAIENARLHEKAQRLAVLQERQRLARELHDSVSQALYGIALGSRTAQKMVDQMQMTDGTKATLIEPLDYILSLSEGGLAEMRALIFELRPESLESEGLVAALVKQATALTARHHIEVASSLEVEPDVSLAAKEGLYRVGQEALNNIVKHAGATKIAVSLATKDGLLILEIKDNGIGFDPNGDFSGHLGLQSMRERMERIGGTLTITSSSGHGSQIVAAVPLA